MASSVPFVAGPFCASCQVPVEEFAYNFGKVARRPDGAITLTAKCHGKTESVTLTADEIAASVDIVLFERGAFDGHNLANKRVKRNGR